jgi:hypothetical protein
MATRGCTNSAAYNYKSTATEDDGSCEIGGCRDTDNNGEIDENDRARPQFDANATYHDGSCPTLFFGCTDPLAYNYRQLCDAKLCEDDGNCKYQGCTDTGAMNFDSVATIPGACLLPVIGCTDSLAINFWHAANQDSGCRFAGCTDSRVPSYDPTATTDNGKCEPVFPGCTDPSATNYHPYWNWLLPGSCRYAGCTDSGSPSFSSAAAIDDGSCVPSAPPSSLSAPPMPIPLLLLPPSSSPQPPAPPPLATGERAILTGWTLVGVLGVLMLGAACCGALVVQHAKRVRRRRRRRRVRASEGRPEPGSVALQQLRIVEGSSCSSSSTHSEQLWARLQHPLGLQPLVIEHGPGHPWANGHPWAWPRAPDPAHGHVDHLGMPSRAERSGRRWRSASFDPRRGKVAATGKARSKSTGRFERRPAHNALPGIRRPQLPAELGDALLDHTAIEVYHTKPPS